MTVIRRLDAVLEPTKGKVLSMKKQLDEVRIANQHAALHPDNIASACCSTVCTAVSCRSGG